ncbi:universal stress protein [Variovorax sp. H27-G14]|uniref:universal stress protein n=1 Tax=Variovorax sp. H27-G14 TaxID=3111914 RepID=UPI0038FC297C
MKFLLETDGSAPALRAVKYAAKLIALMGSHENKVTLVSAHDDTGLRHAKALVGNEAVQDYLRELIDKELRPAKKALDAAGIRHDIVILTSSVTGAIVALANKGKFDMIVLGSKGRGAMLDLLVGSLAQRVRATAKQPATLVK